MAHDPESVDVHILALGPGPKSQTIRLVDVFVLGPFMVWAGLRAMPRGTGAVMAAAGVATIIFNGRNYLEIRARRIA